MLRLVSFIPGTVNVEPLNPGLIAAKISKTDLLKRPEMPCLPAGRKARNFPGMRRANHDSPTYSVSRMGWKN